jgi:hypothetical protein
VSDTSTPAPSAPQAPAPPEAKKSTTQQTNAQTAVNEVLNSRKDQPAPEAAGDDIEDTGEDLAAEEQKKAAKAVAKLKKKLKVGGKEIEVDEDELVKRAQMGFSAEEKWQEASKMKKQVESLIGLLQKDPVKALERLGFNVDELAEKRIQQRIEEMQKSPEQLELEKLRREREEIMTEREKEKQDFQQREIKRMQDEFSVQIENDITKAMDNPSFGLPKSPYFVKRIADVMIYGLTNGKEITADKAAQIVKEEAKKEFQEIYQLTPDEAFEQLIGKERLNKYRRSKVKKTAAPAAGASNVKQTGAAELLQARQENKPQAKVPMKKFFKSLGNK